LTRLQAFIGYMLLLKPPVLMYSRPDTQAYPVMYGYLHACIQQCLKMLEPLTYFHMDVILLQGFKCWIGYSIFRDHDWWCSCMHI